MKARSDSFHDGDYLSAQYAFGKRSADGKIDLADNENPHLSWSELPEGTQSIAIVCVDGDVPTKPDDVNQEGRVVPADLPRTDFCHWLVVDLDPEAEVGEGEFSEGVTPKGKDGPEGPRGTRQGVNDYTGWFAGDPEMAGTYYGYDGPCPPFNDSIVHHYRFTVYALDLARVPVEGTFTRDEVLDAIDRHVLGQASLTAKYTINPDAKEL